MSEERTVKLNDIITTADNIQKYVLGTKKSGYPRAIYDVVKDYTLDNPKNKKNKKRKKKHNHDEDIYSIYRYTKKKKKKGKNKNKNYWHI